MKLRTLCILVTFITGIEIYLLGFSLALPFAILARILFMLKIFGIRKSLDQILILEVISAVTNPLYYFAIAKLPTLTQIVVPIVTSIVCFLIAYYDDKFYVYYEGEE